jgi:hypothetical protein
MPYLLGLGIDCDHYNALPVSGGVLDQPAGLLKKIRQVMNVYNAYKLYGNEGKKPGERAKWKSEHEDIWNIVSEINELRKAWQTTQS